MNRKPDTQQLHGFVRKYDLAFRYFPNAPTKKAATDNLTRAINRCTPLLMTLAQDGYNTTEKSYSPRQVALIYQYLGEP